MQCDQLSHTPATMTLPPRWAAPLNCELKQILSSLNACVRYFVTPKRKVISVNNNSTLYLQPTISLSKHRACQSPKLERVSQNKSLSYVPFLESPCLVVSSASIWELLFLLPSLNPGFAIFHSCSLMGSEPLI